MGRRWEALPQTGREFVGRVLPHRTANARHFTKNFATLLCSQNTIVQRFFA